MAPNPRVAKAFRAMRDLGIPEEKTKPVLKRLLKLYEKNWVLIEEENYRALADTIFDQEDQEETPQVKALETEISEVDETERPLKRLRQKHQDNNGSASINNSGVSIGATPLKHKHSGEGSLTLNLLAEDHPPLSRNKGKQVMVIHEQSDVSKKGVSDRSQQLVIRGTESDSVSPTTRYKDKGKAPLTAETVSRDTNSASLALCLKEPKPEPGTEPLKKKRLVKTCALIKPKDEPVTDGLLENVRPISMFLPDPPEKEVPSLEEHTVRIDNCPVENHEEGHTLKNNKSAQEKAANIVDGPSTDIEIAASPCGEVKISFTCNSSIRRSDFHIPSIDAVLKMVEDKCLRSYKVMDPSFSVTNVMKDMCESFVKLGTDSGNQSQELVDVPQAAGLLQQSDTVPLNNSADADMVECHISMPCPDMNDDQHTDNITAQNGSVNEENGSENSSHLGVQKKGKQIQDGYDIAKGHEKLVITLVNEVNDERPPSFRYIPQNVVFQNAYVNFSLARLGDDHSCADCSGNCLSSSQPCACARDTGGVFAYTVDGLVKEDLLKECISMNRNPQKNCQYYCKECPLERLKNEELLEPCKGHLVRKFIKECWWKCGCNKQCGNRVVQRGIAINLQVFMTPGGKGWGLRTLQELPRGAFVCEYVGEILTNAELFERVSARAEGAHTYPVLLDADWGAEGVLKDEEALCLDATHFGNVARFINHRCFDSNMVEIPVEVETPDHHYYHLAFFTTRKVQAMEELTWDYGIDFDDHEHPVKAFKCQCGSKFCRNIKRNARSKSRR